MGPEQHCCHPQCPRCPQGPAAMQTLPERVPWLGGRITLFLFFSSSGEKVKVPHSWLFPKEGLRPTSSEAPPTLCPICKKNPRRSGTFQLLSARWQRTNQLDAGTGTAWTPGSPDRAWQEGAPESGGDGSTRGERSCPADGVGSSQCRAESGQRWQKRCPEEDSGSEPPRARHRGSRSPGPAPQLRLKGPIVCRPRLSRFGRRNRGAFLLFSMPDLCRSRREGPAAPPRPLPEPRHREPAGRRPEKGALCAGHRVAFPDSAGNGKRESDAVSPRALRRGE